MEKLNVSRRALLGAAGIAGMSGIAAAALGTSAGGARVAEAEDASAEQGAAQPEYMTIFGEDTAYVPVKKAEWDKLHGTVGYESREISADEISRTDTCDFLVVGGGISGMIASLKAADMGAQVICLEKMNRGRNTWESAGAYNTSMQRENDNVPDPAEYAEAILRASGWRARSEIVWSFINNSGEAVDFMKDMLEKAGKGVSMYNTIQDQAPYGMDTIQGEHKIKLPEGLTWNSWFTGPVAFDSLETTAASYENLDLRLNTAGVQLVQDESGRVTGVIAKDADGYYAIESAHGVLLATGGYEANPDLVKAWCRTEDYASACVYAPALGPTGDGHLMGLKIGAAMDPTPHAVMNFRSGLPTGPMDVSKISSCLLSSIWVNHKGFRFCNENLPHNYAANAINAQAVNGKKVWFVLDSALVKAKSEAAPTLMDDMETLKEQGLLVEGDTIAELAEAMGASPSVLEDTIATWNSYFEADEPQDLMYRRNIAKLAPLAEGPFYACVHNAKALCTMSGLTINENAQVLDHNEEVIPGLYAAGNASGGMFFVDYPRHLPSTSVGRCVTFGYVAAVHALSGEEAEPVTPEQREKTIAPTGLGAVSYDPEFQEQCLETYGSYEAVAELTASYGDSNPHNSVHGVYGTCDNCHTADMTVREDQKCGTCHDWPREEQSRL